MSESRITPGVIYKAVLLAFGLVIAAMIFQALVSLVLGVLIVVIIATPLAVFADILQRWRVPRAIGATSDRASNQVHRMACTPGVWEVRSVGDFPTAAVCRGRDSPGGPRERGNAPGGRGHR